MSTRQLLFLAIHVQLLLVKNASLSLGFKIPAENTAELPPRIRPDILQNSRERAYSTDGGNPIETRSQSKSMDKPYIPKKKDARYSDAKYWNEVSKHFQHKRESKKQQVVRQGKYLFGLVRKTVVITLILTLVVSSPDLFCLLFVAFLFCGPWAIAGFALYKSAEVIVEGKSRDLAEREKYANEMENIRYETHVTDSEEIDDSEHIAFQQ